MEIAQAVFSGVRIKEAMSLINRVAEVRPLSKEAKADQDYIFTQLRLITDVRNDILHYGAINLQPGELLVTNWLVALPPCILLCQTDGLLPNPQGQETD